MTYTVSSDQWRTVFAVPTSVVDQHILICGAAALRALLIILRSGGSAGEEEIAEVFGKLRKIYENCSKKYAQCDKIKITVLSMGMSQDYETAIIMGSNLVRIGTAIFQGE